MDNPKIKIIENKILSDNWYTLRKITYEYQKKDGRWETQSREAYDRAVRELPRESMLWVDVARFRDANADALGARDAVDFAIELDKSNDRALAYKANLVRAQHGLTASLRWYDAALAAGAGEDRLGGAGDPVVGVEHVYRNAHCATLISQRAADRVTNPPRSVGREAIAAGVVESLDGLDQAEQGDLGQVVEGLAPRGEPPGAGLGDRLVVDDELVA